LAAAAEEVNGAKRPPETPLPEIKLSSFNSSGHLGIETRLVSEYPLDHPGLREV
jgi:hypothetical protein